MSHGPPAALLPEDLEREIFEISAHSRPVFIPILMLVARRVKIWLEPLLYRTIVLDNPSVLKGYPIYSWAILESKPASFFHHAIDFTHRLFSRITHLELFDRLDSFDPTIWCNLALIPQLTHLAFHGPASATMWPSLLRTCHSLRVLVAFGQMQAMVNSHQDMEKLVKDARFVVAPSLSSVTTDWHRGAHTGIDCWSRAEDFIAKRRSGEINCLQYWIDTDKSRNI
ncbi:hypothetical protein B0H19DRAFT_1258885 [Mycena capillaripes]|nr:hypothetical protein B0H19DRAFT_1258885 [Mycena capillaripes]